jgi:glutamate-5-semialdehyde dehydrogenase
MRANEKDVQDARDAGLDEPLVKRLEISGSVFQYMLSRLTKVAALPDPVGPNELTSYKWVAYGQGHLRK